MTSLHVFSKGKKPGEKDGEREEGLLIFKQTQGERGGCRKIEREGESEA